MCAKDKRTATENVRCRCFIVLEKKSEKPYGGEGVATTPSPCHPRVKQFQVTILNLGPKLSVKFPSIIRLKLHHFC